MPSDDDVPVLKRSGRETNCHPHGPLGLALLILAALTAALVLLLMHRHAGPFTPPAAPTRTLWSPAPNAPYRPTPSVPARQYAR
ncbi:hypothetical protein NX794_27715 [Streptomyces sp. LP11]|uniref:Secreted protein n=1 Tax=Streptomyces pyxinicus TaxID=2970331 RepID=A0ABT2BAK6_9ACTN|nr:hypothetical protein [Streptomyces sp. LP11]MCS0604968.1 hypothetical protein [Streptomyces sp. LP11]